MFVVAEWSYLTIKIVSILGHLSVRKEFSMARRPVALLFACGLTSLAIVVAASLPIELSAASKATKKPIKNPKFDPTAEKVDLFEAVEAQQVSVKLIPRDAKGGTVLIENKTDKPLTVKIPDAVAGVSIHSQFGGMGGGGMGGMGGGGMGGGGMGGGGGGQQMGGGMGGGGMGGMGGGGMGGGGMGGAGGGGFFSIPAEKVVSLQFNSVCLEHGKPEPGPNSKYTIVPLSRVSTDPVLYQLLTKVGTGKVDSQAAQAAAWHLTDKMSFEQLAEKVEEHLGDANPSPYFTRDQLLGAQVLLSQAMAKADEKEESDKLAPAAVEETSPRTTRTARASSN